MSSWKPDHCRSHSVSSFATLWQAIVSPDRCFFNWSESWIFGKKDIYMLTSAEGMEPLNLSESWEQVWKTGLQTPCCQILKHISIPSHLKPHEYLAIQIRKKWMVTWPQISQGPFTFFLADKSNLYLLGEGQENKITFQFLKSSYFLCSRRKRHHQQHRPKSGCFLNSCHLFIIRYHIIQSFKSDLGGLWWTAGSRSRWCMRTAGVMALARVLPCVTLGRCRSAPCLATESTSSLLTHKVIRRWGKLRISFRPEIWLSLRPVPKGKF